MAWRIDGLVDGSRKRPDGPKLDGPEPFWKKYQKVPIKIGMGIAIAIGFVFLIFSLGGASPPQWKKAEKQSQPTRSYWINCQTLGVLLN